MLENIITNNVNILIRKYIIAGVHNFFNDGNIMIYLKKKIWGAIIRKLELEHELKFCRRLYLRRYIFVSR
jgi:hypothetical protein